MSVGSCWSDRTPKSGTPTLRPSGKITRGLVAGWLAYLVGVKLVYAITPRPLLHLEGAAVLAVSLFSYHWRQASWFQFALLFLVPDVSMLGYAANVRIGAISYNSVHC